MATVEKRDMPGGVVDEAVACCAKKSLPEGSDGGWSRDQQG